MYVCAYWVGKIVYPALSGPALRYRLAAAAERRMLEFNAQNLANTACAFAMADQSTTLLFAAQLGSSIAKLPSHSVIS